MKRYNFIIYGKSSLTISTQIGTVVCKVSGCVYNSSLKDECTDAKLDTEVSAANLNSLQGTASLNIEIDRIINDVSESSDNSN